MNERQCTVGRPDDERPACRVTHWQVITSVVVEAETPEDAVGVCTGDPVVVPYTAPATYVEYRPVNGARVQAKVHRGVLYTKEVGGQWLRAARMREWQPVFLAAVNAALGTSYPY